MSSPTIVSTAPENPPLAVWPLYRALVGVGVICSLLIVAAYRITLPIIHDNQVAARQAAILQVLPQAKTTQAFALQDDGRFAPAGAADAGKLVFAGYDADGKLVGVAVEAQGMGYQDLIRVLYGYAPGQQAIVGIRVLDSRETPGLGNRIESDPQFLANFTALDVTLDASGERLQHAIELVKGGTKSAPWQIDGITGATISSRAIADMLRASTGDWIPKIAARLEDLRQEGSR